MKALEEHVYIKGLNKKVRELIKRCGICQRVKVNNERKEGALINITSDLITNFTDKKMDYQWDHQMCIRDSYRTMY